MSKPVFSDLFSFNGRRNRKSYLLYSLAIWTVFLLGLLIVGLVREHVDLVPVKIFNLIFALLFFITLVVSDVAVTAQRCRDIGITGWLALLFVLPMVGWIFSIWVMVMPGTHGPNKYGPDPLAPELSGA
jgi:uncharacterized membrane protein YhaH (DUF805 family)